MKIRVVIDAQSFEVEVGDLNVRPIPVTVDGDTFMVWPDESGSLTKQAEAKAAEIAERAAQVSAQPATQAAARMAAPANGVKTVPAPIPGVIISIVVAEGDSVSFGQELCVLEAMKMKNVIRANRAGTIAAVCIAAGDQVRHGQALFEYTD